MFDLNNTIRNISPNSGLENAGIGYVIIPDVEDLSREEFIKLCYKTETVCIDGGLNYGLFYDVSVDRETMKSIIFNKEKGKHGSPVVWLNIPQWQKPVIIAVLKYENDTFASDEGELNHERTENGNSIYTSMSSKNAVVDLNVIANGTTNGKININLLSSNNTGELNIYIKGKSKIHSTEEIKLISDKRFILTIVDEDAKERVYITYEKSKGYIYKDEFGNEMNCKDGLVEIISKKINHNKGSEPMVLGAILEDKLNKILDAISKLTVPTALGPSGVPINTPEFKSIQAIISEIKSELSFLD